MKVAMGDQIVIMYGWKYRTAPYAGHRQVSEQWPMCGCLAAEASNEMQTDGRLTGAWRQTDALSSGAIANGQALCHRVYDYDLLLLADGDFYCCSCCSRHDVGCYCSATSDLLVTAVSEFYYSQLTIWRSLIMLVTALYGRHIEHLGLYR